MDRCCTCCNRLSKVTFGKVYILVSVIYRTWTRVKAQILLQRMDPYISAKGLGFLPHRELAQIWMGVQGCVELSFWKVFVVLAPIYVRPLGMCLPLNQPCCAGSYKSLRLSCFHGTASWRSVTII